MNEGQEDQTTEPVGVPAQLIEPAAPAPAGARFFQPTDRLGFALTTVLVFFGYFFTLPPEVTLEDSGALSTAAMYAGVPRPPGHPLWAMYGWFFTVALPVSNIAWRLAFSSAMAGALTCGLIALMVSRGGTLILEGIPGSRRLYLKEERLLCLGCGCAAGTVFGFDGSIWDLAVVVGAWPLTLLLLSIVLCLLMRWLYRPEEKRFLYAAIFVYSLTVTNSQTMIPAVLGMQFIVMLGNRKLGRDMFFLDTLLIGVCLLGDRLGWLSLLQSYISRLQAIHIAAGIGSGIICGVLILITRSLFTSWRTVVFSGIALLAGATPYLYLPLASMANPPMNWGYPRTIEGFFHLVTRGQFEMTAPAHTPSQFLGALLLYGEIAVKEFGLVCLLFVPIPFCIIRRLRPLERSWMLGLLAVYGCLSILVLLILNPSGQAGGMMTIFFSASHIILAVWMGYGLVLVGSFLTRPRVRLPPGGEIKP